MRKLNSNSMFVILLILLINICACHKSPPVADSGQNSEPVQTDAIWEAQNDNNQIANQPAPATKAPTKATIVVQIHSASTNRKAFSVSLEGMVGDAAPRVAPGGGVNLQKEISSVDGKFPVNITISRNGAAIIVLSQSITSTSSSVIIFENKVNEFTAQWI